MINLRNLYLNEIEALLDGQPRYRASQLFSRIHKGAKSFDELTQLPSVLRRTLSESCHLGVPELSARESSSDGTHKLLWRFTDGCAVESVVMRYDYGDSVCVSTQAGCRMGCRFCASATGGLQRNLEAGEILAQLLFSGIETNTSPRRVTLMGVGEPLDNFPAVERFLKLVTHPEGMNFSARHITISTCGLPEGMERLAELELPVTLTISLHAPEDELRRRLMPGASELASVEKLMSAAKSFEIRTRRRVSFEYIIIDGVNDREEHARMLARLVGGSHVNLIQHNPMPGSVRRGGSSARSFAGSLRAKGVNVTIRRRLGSDISGACGQLRASVAARNETNDSAV